MKIFSGLYSVDSGDIYVNGEKVTIRNTKDSQNLGISIIYQEFDLVPYLTVAQNIFLGREPLKKDGSINQGEMRKKSREYLEFLRANIDVDAKVCTLGVAQQQLVEVAKAVSQDVYKRQFMTYANVVFSYGSERFISKAAQIGINGLILPDVPYEEKEEFEPICRKYGRCV